MVILDFKATKQVAHPPTPAWLCTVRYFRHHKLCCKSNHQNRAQNDIKTIHNDHSIIQVLPNLWILSIHVTTPPVSPSKQTKSSGAFELELYITSLKKSTQTWNSFLITPLSIYVQMLGSLLMPLSHTWTLPWCEMHNDDNNCGGTPDVPSRRSCVYELCPIFKW